MNVQRSNGGYVIRADAYRLRLQPDAWTAQLTDANGQPWADVCLVAALDAVGERDETSGVQGPVVDGRDDHVRLRWDMSGGPWAEKRLYMDCSDDAVTLWLEVVGSRPIATLTMLGGHGIGPDGFTGPLWSRPAFRTLFSPAPSDPGSIVHSATVNTDISVAGGAEPGRGQWFFTPAPFWYAVSRSEPAHPRSIPDGPWLGFGLNCQPEEQRFLGFGFRARDGGFRFELDFEGHTRVEGAWRSPRLVVAPAGDPWSGLRAYAGALDVAAVGARRPDARPTPGWWREPIFCGWGAQCALAADRGLPLAGAATLATQANYDGWLAHLEGHGVVPGTIVIDDKWERRYGTGRPDSEKWPDLRGWIAERHRRGQRVLLWWKAWDPEGLDPTRTVRAANGTPVAIDPNNPRARHAIGDAVRNVLGADGLAADGLKIDFTARTPSGASLLHAPGTWGIGLLRELLRTIRGAAKRTNPDCLLVGQVVEPSLAPLIDMIRLNDQLRLDDPDQPSTVVPQMRYRAGVVQAACPGHIVDTDDWCALDLADWRAYTAIKPELGVPALYYAGILDRTLERFEERDYALIRDTWRAYRHAQGLLARATPADVGEASGLG